MKFTELSEENKTKAVKDYIKGWKETHPEETLSIEEATILCIDSNEDVEFGEMKEEIFNQDYAHLSLGELKEELERLEALTKEVEPVYNSDEIFNIQIEIETREEYLKQTKGETMIPDKKDQVPGLMAKYALLEYGDIIKEGDKYYNPFHDRWLPVEKESIGQEWGSDHSKPVRRRF